MQRKSMLVILIAAIVLTVGAGAYYVKSNGQKDENLQLNSESKLIQEIDADHMYKMVDDLSKQPREAGTEGELRAVKYIEKEFKRLGYKTEIQEFPIYNFKTNHVSVKIGDAEIGDTPLPFTGDANGQIRAPLVYVGKARPWEINEDIKGKVALVERGDITFVAKIENLLKKGAVGAVMFNNSPDGIITGQLPEDITFPAVAISRNAGLELVEQVKANSLDVSLDVDVEKLKATSYNVVAARKPDRKKDTGQLVTIGAHHDSVPEGPGANDDASGVSAVLELARVYAQAPIDTEIRFLTFGSEERGLNGSIYYTKQLPKSDVNRMVGHFQLDMIGARAAGGTHPAGGLIMYTIDGRKNLVTDLVAAAGKEVLSEVIPFGKEGRSDHQPFHELGIPTALFIDAPVEADYHKPTDTIDKISKQKLAQAAKVVGAAVYHIAGQETPAVEKTKAVSTTIDYPFEQREVE